MKTHRIKEIFILLIALLGFISAGNLMPDPQNPILISKPNTNYSPDITARFCLDPKGRGMGFNQVIGLAFPASVKATLNFDASLKYSCSLTAGSKTITVTAVKPLSASEGNIAYCQLTDRVNTLIAAGENLTLKVTLTTLKFSVNWIRGMKIFTATSNKATKMYIDSAPYLGSVALYGDADAYSTSSPIIEMSSPTMMQKAVSITSINPETKFDLSVNLNSKVFLNKDDFVMTFKFDNQVVKAPTSVTSTKIPTADAEDKLAEPLSGDLELTLNSAKNMITLNGIKENLVPGRKFQINLKGFVALPTKTSQFSAFEMNVYYKNTYSLLVNQKTISSSNIFKVNPNVITLTANHPDSFDVFRSGVFPTRFTFKSASDINTPVNILLQHANAKTGKNEYSFVASSCDFSENDSSFSQAFGSRPTCYPYRTDFDYKDASNSKDFNGSAIFFTLKNMKSATTYYLTVWGSADNCGGDGAANFKSSLDNTLDTTKTKFKYSMTAYNGIDGTALNEARLNTQAIVGQTAAAVSMGNTCWNAVMNLPDSFAIDKDSTFNPAIQPFKESVFKTLIKTNDSANKPCDVQGSGAAACKMSHDVNLYREFTNVQLINHTTVVPTNNYLGDMSNTTDVNNAENYLYGATTVTSSSYFALQFEIPVAASSKVFEILPSPVAFDAATGAANTSVYRVQPGRLEFKFQKTWFTTGDAADSTSPGCYIGWGNNDGTLTYNNNVMRNFATPKDVKDCAAITENGANNFLTSYTNNKNADKIDCSTAVANMDTTNSVLPSGSDSSKANFRILSTWNSSGKGVANETNKASGSSKDASNTTFNWPVETKNMNKTFDDKTSKLFGLFSSCLKFNTAPSTIKSLWASMDIQINYLYNLKSTNTEAEINNSIPHRAVRLIKLFPEGGVFQDITTNSGKKVVADSVTNYPNPSAANGANRSFKYHYALGKSASTTGVCLIEIYGSGLGATADTTSTVLAIWIGYGVLLETDYSDVAATYPVSPLASSTVVAYGLQASYNMNMNSNLYNFKAYTSDNDITKPTGGQALDLLVYSATGKTQGVTTTIYNYRSSYTSFMGSLVLINGLTNGAITTNSNADNLLIPTYCTVHDDTKGRKHIDGLPTLYMAFISMTSYNSITAVNRIFSQKVVKDKYTTVITATGLDANSYRSTMAAAKVLSDKDNYYNYLFTLRFADYSSTVTDNDSLLYLYYGSVNANSRTFTPQKNSVCSGYLLLLNDSLTVDSTKLKSTIMSSATPQYYNNGTKKFYYLGMDFTKSLMFGYGNAVFSDPPTDAQGNLSTKSGDNYTSNYPIAKTSNLSVTGIKRPNIETYFNAKTGVYTGPANSIGFFCSSYSKDSTELFTNYLITGNTSATSSFSLDFNPLAITSTKDPKIAVTFTKDSGDIFLSDVASNTKMAVTLPYSVPGGWNLQFKSQNNAITTDSMCGIISGSSNAAVSCTNSSNEMICQLPASATAYSLCCYNIKTLSSDTIKVNNMKVVQPAQPSASATFNTLDVYTMSETFDSTASMGAKPAIDTSAKISNINYSHVIQENGFGKLHMKLTLPRDPVRNMLITVGGDLTSHKITDVTPRCMVTFGKSFGEKWNSGDILLDTCDVSGLDSATSPIKITTRNMIYRCGLSFSSAKTVTVMLWPIKVANWGIAPYNENTYNVKMQLNSSSPANIAVNTANEKVKTSLTFLDKPLVEYNENLCNIQKVTPLLPGEMAEWIFDFDLDHLKTKYEKETLNEVSIFWGYDDFGGINNRVLCKYEGAFTPCAFSDEGILNVRFSANLKIGSGKKISVSIMNITNPTVYTDISFTCTVNNLTAGVRRNIITGKGKLTNGIKLNESLTEGVLRFVNKITTTDSNPRNTSNHSFKMMFDDAVGLTKLPITIENNPFLIITFPSNYNFGNFPNNKFTCGIDEYKTAEGSTDITKAQSLNIKDCFAVGNTIRINIFQAKYEFDAQFKHWEVKIQNVVNPADTTSPNGSNTTGQFGLLLTNDDYSSLYRSYQDLNNAATNAMATPIDDMINMNRGIEFKFDNKKWVIDFMDGNNKNMLAINPGRFLNANMCIRNLDATADMSVATITLDDSTFKLAAKSYSITPVRKSPVPIYIGVPCGTVTGRYLINFSMTESNGSNYAPLTPVLAVVDGAAKAAKATMIMASDTIPISSSMVIRYNLGEPNVDELSVTFKAGKGATNDETAKISEVKIPTIQIPAGDLFNAANTPVVSPNVMGFSIFEIKSDAKTTQSFVANDINTCFSWANANVNINFSGEVAKFADKDYSTSFKYMNGAKDKPTEMNALKFTYTSDIFPVYLYCALVCNNKDYPSDETILAYNTPNTPLVQYYMGVFTDKNPQTILFKNLVRNMQYKMRCILKNTSTKSAGNSTDNTKPFNYANAGNNATDSTPVPIMTEKLANKTCIQYLFNEEVAKTPKQKLVEYCQKMFTEDNWSDNGCVICSDSLGNIMAPGISMPKGVKCEKDVVPANKTLRFLQDSPANKSDVIDPASDTKPTPKGPYPYTICATPSPLCATNVNKYNKEASTYIKVMGELNKRTVKSKVMNDLGFSNSTYNSSVLFSDDGVPDMSKVEISIVKTDKDGYAQWKSKSTDMPLICSWRIAPKDKAPSQNDILTCTDNSWCGKNYQISAFDSFGNTDENNKKAFVSGQEYHISFVCSKDVPSPLYYSPIKKVTLSIPNKPSNDQKSDVTPSPISTNSTVDPNSGAYLSSKTMMILNFILILFFTLF